VQRRATSHFFAEEDFEALCDAAAVASAVEVQVTVGGLAFDDDSNCVSVADSLESAQVSDAYSR
jgi:hypothetical protein